MPIAHHLKQRALVIVHKGDLIDGWKAELVALGLRPMRFANFSESCQYYLAKKTVNLLLTFPNLEIHPSLLLNTRSLMVEWIF